MSEQDNNQTPSKTEIAKEALASYKAADDEVKKAKDLLDEANRKRSQAVENILNKLGKGPFEYKGEQLGKIVQRGDTYFFRIPSDQNVMKID